MSTDTWTGKGSNRRPSTVSKEKFAENWDNIFSNNKKWRVNSTIGDTPYNHTFETYGEALTFFRKNEAYHEVYNMELVLQ